MANRRPRRAVMHPVSAAQTANTGRGTAEPLSTTRVMAAAMQDDNVRGRRASRCRRAQEGAKLSIMSVTPKADVEYRKALAVDCCDAPPSPSERSVL